MKLRREAVMKHAHVQRKLTQERLRGRRGKVRGAAPAAAKPDKWHRRPPVAVDAFFSRFAQRLGLPGGANLVFGERVEHDGVVVVPVARAVWGLGGGVSGDDEGNPFAPPRKPAPALLHAPVPPPLPQHYATDPGSQPDCLAATVFLESAREQMGPLPGFFAGPLRGWPWIRS